MDMKIQQTIHQEQKLILTNQMKLSLQLLQMPIYDLQECIEKELDENPLLEIDYDNVTDTKEPEYGDNNKDNESLDYEKNSLSNKKRT